MEDIKNLDSQIRCEQNHLRALYVDVRELARAAIYRIREREQKSGLSERPPYGQNPFVHNSIELINMAIEKDPKNSRRYARIAAADFQSMANVARKKLEGQGIKDDYAKRFVKWEADKEAAKKSGYYHPSAFACAPDDPYYYAKSDEQTAKSIRGRYGL